MLSINTVLLLLCIACKSDALLCYNGTFSYKTHGNDLVTFKGLSEPSQKQITRLRCWLTIPCMGGGGDECAQMSRVLLWVVLGCCFNSTLGLLCFNCSSTHLSWSQCAGDFAPPFLPFNSSNKYLKNCTGEIPMCFVRSWRARSRHAWIVQRGCYISSKADPLPKAMFQSTRSMTCMRRRLIDAEYKVCLCQSDWCNTTPTNYRPKELYLLCWSLGALAYIFNLSSCIF